MSNFFKDVVMAALVLFVILLIFVSVAPALLVRDEDLSHLATIDMQQLVTRAKSGDLLATSSKLFHCAHGHLVRGFTRSRWSHVAIVIGGNVLEIVSSGFRETPLQQWLTMRYRDNKVVVWSQLHGATDAYGTIGFNRTTKLSTDYTDWFTKRHFGFSIRKQRACGGGGGGEMLCSEFVHKTLQHMGIASAGRKSEEFDPGEIINAKFDLLGPHRYSCKTVVLQS
jgi:hypothetical protein